VVFLDIDGVLAPIRRWDRYGDLDPGCIRVLNAIVAGAGFIGCVIDKTPTGAPGAGRGDEIAAWLAEHAVGGYVIIDDHGDMGRLRAQLVLTHPARGLQPDDAPRALEILKRPGL
jgi:hypothetical protein